MHKLSSSHLPRPRVTDRIEQIGLLLWKSAVLVIGLRFALVVPTTYVDFTYIAWATMLLYGIACTLIALSMLRFLWDTTTWLFHRRTACQTLGLQDVWCGWLRRDWQLAFAIDCMLATVIISLAITLAAQERLDWQGGGWLATSIVLRVGFQELYDRAAEVAQKPKSSTRPPQSYS